MIFIAGVCVDLVLGLTLFVSPAFAQTPLSTTEEWGDKWGLFISQNPSLHPTHFRETLSDRLTAVPKVTKRITEILGHTRHENEFQKLTAGHPDLEIQSAYLLKILTSNQAHKKQLPRFELSADFDSDGVLTPYDLNGVRLTKNAGKILVLAQALGYIPMDSQALHPDRLELFHSFLEKKENLLDIFAGLASLRSLPSPTKEDQVRLQQVETALRLFFENQELQAVGVYWQKITSLLKAQHMRILSYGKPLSKAFWPSSFRTFASPWESLLYTVEKFDPETPAGDAYWKAIHAKERQLKRPETSGGVWSSLRVDIQKTQELFQEKRQKITTQAADSPEFASAFSTNGIIPRKRPAPQALVDADEASLTTLLSNEVLIRASANTLVFNPFNISTSETQQEIEQRLSVSGIQGLNPWASADVANALLVLHSALDIAGIEIPQAPIALTSLPTKKDKILGDPEVLAWTEEYAQQLYTVILGSLDKQIREHEAKLTALNQARADSIRLGQPDLYASALRAGTELSLSREITQAKLRFYQEQKLFQYGLRQYAIARRWPAHTNPARLEQITQLVDQALGKETSLGKVLPFLARVNAHKTLDLNGDGELTDWDIQLLRSVTPLIRPIARSEFPK